MTRLVALVVVCLAVVGCGRVDNPDPCVVVWEDGLGGDPPAGLTFDQWLVDCHTANQARPGAGP